MNKTLKKTLSIILTILMIVTTVPFAFAADIVDSGTFGANGDNLTWTFDSDGVLTISGEGEMNINDEDAPWTDYMDRIKTVVVEDGVTTIGDYAFCHCSELREITIPDSVIIIGFFAFADCTGLTEIDIPDSVTSIGDYAFYDCTELTEITIPGEVTSIGDYTFWHCKSLTKITISDSVTTIGCAFGLCYGLTEIDIPDSVTTISGGAFYECTGLTEITIPDSVQSIGDLAFVNCTGLTEVTIPDSVTTIVDTAFLGCTNLTTVNVSCIWDGTIYSFEDTVTLNRNVHKFTEYNQTKAPECGVAGEEVAECDHNCGATGEREIPALEHIDEDGNYLCDHGCGHEFEKPAEDTCDRCGEVHDNFFQNFICLIKAFFNRIISFFTGLFK